MLFLLRTGFIPVITILLVLQNCQVYVLSQIASQNVPHGNVVPPAAAPNHVGNVPSEPNVVGVDPRFSDGANVNKNKDIPPNQASGAAAPGLDVPNAIPNQPVHTQQHIVPDASVQNSGNVMPAQAEGMSNQVPADQGVSPGMMSANQIHPSQVNDNFANQPSPPNVNVRNLPSDHVVVQPPNSHPGGGQPQAPVSFQGHPNQLPAAHTPAHIPRPVESVPHPGHLPVHQSMGGNGPVHEGVPIAPVPQQFGFHPDPSIPQFQGVPHHGEAPDVYNQFRHAHETNEPPRSRSHDENPPDEFVSMAIIVPSGSKNCYFYTPMLDFIVYHQERVEGLYGRLHRIKLLQQRSNNFAAADKALMESNLSRVSSRSIVQVILMFGVATFQVILIRAFFDPNSRFYRIWFGKRSVAGARC
ncbi:hypothetical protein D915_007275 [Fasciola hepatica]|uniref:GOLD domain-containing protein n=1 Tax=Fasciola hepatica TaxID=6192 RepID=A0A4E0R3U4_FASHE|nr:hypothetical protein D915_007275 [Fasciola hepatica]